MHNTETELDKLLAAVLSSPKYQLVAPEFVRRLGEIELAKRRNWKAAVKAVKNKLHQVGGAYLTDQMGYQDILNEIKTIDCEFEPLKEICLSAMRRHTSTRERLPFLEEFYSVIFQELPPIQSILDVACGLNPLARPWMPLPSETRYLAVDIYRDLTDFVQGFFNLCKIPGQTWAADVIESIPQNEVDLALVLKSLPCLEQVDNRAGEKLMESLNACFLLVSFPAHSIGGHEKGMTVHYPERFQKLASSKNWDYQRFDFPGEIAFLIKK